MKPDLTSLWLIKIRVPDIARVSFENALEPFCLSLTSMLVDSNKTNGEWNIEGLFSSKNEKKPIEIELIKSAKYTNINPVPKPKYFYIKSRNWVEDNQTSFPPLYIGRYFIHGSHFEGIAPIASIKLELNAGSAFGSGKHPSTAGCLKALDFLARRNRFHRPLDMGCGSGILAIAIAKTWHVKVVACDIEKEATSVTSSNAEFNNVKKLILVRSGASYKTPVVAKGRPYDLITSNILARPLKAMSRDLVNALAPRGLAVLSGFLIRDSQFVIQAHQTNGLKLVKIIKIDDWATIILKR
jgi:ribosomal protein L11 methyltransferase